MSGKHYFPQTIVILLIIFFASLVTLSQHEAAVSTIVQHIQEPSLLGMSDTMPDPTIIPNISGPVKLSSVVDPALSARAALIVDMASGDVLYAKNEDLPLWPASTTKVMSALVVIDAYELSEIVTVHEPVIMGRVMGLYAGEQISVYNLLYGMLIHSANDAAYALADFHPEGRDGFVAAMNKKAVELDLLNTHFVDPAGFDNEKQYSTASDLAELTRYALQNETIGRIVSIPSITISDANYVTFHRLQNVNELLGVVPGTVGGKTGYTENAKENLINVTKREDHEILTVVLGSDDRFGETQILTEWAFANYTWED